MKARSSDTLTTQQNGDSLAMSSASNGHIHDLSILRKPIQTSITGFHEAMKAYNDGTDEIRKLLANECDIIYECKACRNIFRSLANFISHKRIYCKNQFNSAHHFDFRRHNGCIDQDISTIIQAEHDHLLVKKIDSQFTGTTGKLNSVNGSGSSSGLSKDKNQDKDLGSIIDRLVRREQANRLMKLDDFYDQVNQNLTQDEIINEKKSIKLEDEQKIDNEQQQNEQDDIDNPILKLDKVAANNNVAVYQTIKSNNELDDIKREVNEVHDLMEKENTVLGPDGKILAADIVESAAGPLATKLDYSCEICSNKFSTEKTLKLHIKAKHITSTFVYPCPSCSQTFLQPSAVIRHLNNDHKKSMRRIRLMRDAIYRRRTRIDEVPVKGPNRELARLQTDKERADAQSKLNSAAYNNWLADSDSHSVIQSICAHCGKSFERRAALLTHTKTCSQKNAKPSSSTLNGNELSASTSNDDNGKNSQNTEDSSQNSLDNFMRMLNREKQIQAQVENEILIESNRASPVIVSESISQSNSMDADLTNLMDNTESMPTNDIGMTTKNKRKRNRARKADLEPMSTIADDDMSYWNMDEDGNLKILKTDPVNGEFVINVTSNEVETLKETEEASASPSSPSTVIDDCIEEDTTTDCTICERQFANLSNLRRHVAMFHYRQKKFGCNLCEVRAFRKIDIVNHLQTVHSIGNENQEASKLVIVIDIDKNKFSEEKIKAVAHAICKKRDKLENRLKAEVTTTTTTSNTQSDDTEIIPECGSSSSGSDTPKVSKTTKDSIPTAETNKNNNVDFEMAIDATTTTSKNKIEFESTTNDSTHLVHSPDESSSFTPPNSVTKDETKFSRNSSNSSLSADDSKPIKRKLSQKSAPNSTKKCTNDTKQLSRNSSNNSLSDECKPTRRPVRKRIKTVNKDFVYDLSNLLKKEAEAYKEQHINMPITTRTNKRKVQVINIPDDCNKDVVTLAPAVTSVSAVLTSLAQQSSPIKSIVGAAKEMAKIAVTNSRAAFNEIPQIPPERSIIPAKIIQMRQRSESIANLPNWSLSASSSSPTKKLKSTNGRSLSIDKMMSGGVPSKRRRRSSKKSTTPHSSSFTNSLLAATIATSNLSISQAKLNADNNGMPAKLTTNIKEILDRKIFQSNNSIKSQCHTITTTTTNNNGTKSLDDGTSVTTCPTEEEFERYMSANRLNETDSLHYIVPESAAASLAYTSNYDSTNSSGNNVIDTIAMPLSANNTSSPITPPTKRITLLQRLAENKNRKLQQQSLLKSNYSLVSKTPEQNSNNTI